jgi:hypothetical protein
MCFYRRRRLFLAPFLFSPQVTGSSATPHCCPIFAPQTRFRGGSRFEKIVADLAPKP